ncbi:type VI secretion system baseplate subunit TssK [Corallococcus sp. bb12-1]|uniref:type VI secretion system baseplate subunit TssK n=1 Tax=Corallococcus sp. bb12-1 TaxID=2996784 RepID=UPI00226E3D5C|nr:type VI secretion system baseplate subunit TssK [Corallococcus sp. bb12-1]MCY1042027.1 type VI secretion system baseplate subunit TssK [Corallococcus sp. bb12-1]
MNPDTLARVLWQEGQTLLPEHFRAQEESLSTEARLYAGLAGLPVVGVSALRFNEVLLTKGTVALEELEVIMPGGHLVEVPGNADVTPLSLEEAGRTRVTVYLHLLAVQEAREDVPAPGEEASPVVRAVRQLCLSLDPVVDGGVSRLALAVFTREAEGPWLLSSTGLPPLLRVGPHPFLEPLFAQLDGLLQQARGQLRTSLQEGLVRGDRLASARRALCEVRGLQVLRQDMRNGVQPPPYLLMQALRRLYFETCCYLESEPDDELPAYEHDTPGPGLARWMELLTRGFRPHASPLSYRAFDCQDGHFRLGPLPRETPPPNDFYLLVRRQERDQPRSMEGVKLASPLRLPAVRRQALKGVPYRRVPYPSFPHAFDADIDWYQLTHQNEEWEAAQREDGLTFFATPPLEGAQVLLYWRRA